MKSAILISLFFLFCLAGFASDTLRYPNGKIQAVYQRHKFYKHYYSNGQIEYYRKNEGFIRKGKAVNYDSLGNITSRGKVIMGNNEHGRWRYYTNGHHDSTVRYKYGLPVKELRNSKGRHVKCILTYGFAAGDRRLCEEDENKYRVRYHAVAGCVVTSELVFRTEVHNFFIYLGKNLKHGRNWEEKIRSAHPRALF